MMGTDHLEDLAEILVREVGGQGLNGVHEVEGPRPS